jgi:hypothetical protein
MLTITPPMNPQSTALEANTITITRCSHIVR